MTTLLAIYGSPRRHGNTSSLLRQAVAGARAAGAEVEEIVLRDLKISPCLEIYGCKFDGQCVLQDDFQAVRDRLLAADGLMLATPVFFYAVSAHTKILMDRCQSLWVGQHWVAAEKRRAPRPPRPALLISVGATRGRRLFDGVLLSMRYFLDALDMTLWKTLLYRELDLKDAVLHHPAYLAEAYAAGRELATQLRLS